MLRAFGEICLAVEFAHMRGIVHRDLKPSNIMLGDYGEVYILDWGLARVFSDTTTDVVTTDIDSLDGHGEPSQLLGTPGYIAPSSSRPARRSRAPSTSTRSDRSCSRS